VRIPWVIVAVAAVGFAVPAKAAPDPKKITGFVDVPVFGQPMKAKGAVKSVTHGKPKDDRVAWTFVVADAKDETFTIELPANVPLDLAAGAKVAVDFRISGGGPNARGNLRVSDDKGVVVAASFAPDAWKVDKGKQLKSEKGDPYDEASFAVKITPAKGKTAEVSDWAIVELDGAKFVASGSAAQRTMHKGALPPPDYVSAWLDFDAIRLGSR
jgi:hypothetical protein